MTVLAIALGGALGSVSRYLIAVRFASSLGVGVPYGTLTVNLLGCLALGIVIALIEERAVFSREMRSLITVGFLGGMTTFSAFIYEDWQFARDEDFVKAGLYVAASVVLGFTAFAAGHAATKTLV